jgi:hypothetical protein
MPLFDKYSLYSDEIISQDYSTPSCLACVRIIIIHGHQYILQSRIYGKFREIDSSFLIFLERKMVPNQLATAQPTLILVPSSSIFTKCTSPIMKVTT